MDHEQEWDKRLQIRTAGRDDINADEYRYPYEPTPYAVLERLRDSGLIGEEDRAWAVNCLLDKLGLSAYESSGCEDAPIEDILAAICDYAAEKGLKK